MGSRNRSGANRCFFDYKGGNAARNVRAGLKTLIQEGEKLNIEDSESVREWINVVFDELRSFPSEHRTFRLHCLHTGLALLSISMSKADEMEQVSSKRWVC